MVLKYKSPRSTLETSLGSGEGKARFNRKLTGPPRLLLSKSKAKSDLETREDTLRMHTEGRKSYGNHGGSMTAQRSTIQEERSPGCISENQEKTVESEVKLTTPENLFGSEGWHSGNQSGEKTEHFNTKSEPKKKSMRVWKRFFSSLNCISRRRKILSKVSSTEDVTFHNTQSETFECDTEKPMNDTIPPEQQENAQTNNHQGCKSVNRMASFSIGVRKNVTKQLIAPCHHKKTKRQSEQELHFGYLHSLRPDLFLRKRMGRLLKQGPKKTSPFVQLERNHEHLEEESIVLSNRHADNACQKTPLDVQEGSNSIGDVEESGSQSDVLTVSVEVSAVEERYGEERETNAGLEAPENYMITSGQQETAACEEKAVEGTIPQHRITDKDSIQDNLALKTVKFDGLLSYYDDTNGGVENGPEVLFDENLRTKYEGCKHSLQVKVLYSQCSDVLLVQTACSLVQAAMKAALEQLTEELKSKSARIHTEYHEFQDDVKLSV